eukprot:gnl/TRDRNA2_/TRDRNA2_179570_c0_seq1.p1 gnl/TRDRNA2_/TRDRNA2_179570_c0~~gnl/TRDRNA2_/TRDRNA2_179570_c0_seq1.p1  ORF type:complete len:938 (+),score=209.71 gnl/TRDRNA2_/TRDRNA2_179570_c0_seq1:75-2888(+)
MARDGTKGKEIPWCTTCLVVTALICHSLVLAGNIYTSQMFHVLGQSTAGWSSVGLQLSDAMKNELDHLMAKTSTELNAAIGQIMVVQNGLDSALGAAGKVVESVRKTSNGKFYSVDNQTKTITLQQMEDADWAPFDEVMDKTTDELKKFIAMIKPALLQVGKWLNSFGDKMQTFIEQFGTTMDRVQKMFDQVMTKINHGGKGKETLLFNTFTLFDVSNTGAITLQDLHDVSNLYSISALQGDKGKQLLQKYNKEMDGQLTKAEFEMLVQDDQLPNVMSTVLRQYAKKLSQIGGEVAAAKQRDEVAQAVVRYFQLVCAKNMTKVGWVSDALTNGSLPEAFTADIMATLALEKENPNAMTSADVGQIVLSEMVRLNKDYVHKILIVMSDAGFWAKEGFHASDHSDVIAQVTEWIAHAYDTHSQSEFNSVNEAMLQIFSEGKAKVNKQNPDLEERVSSRDHLIASAKAHIKIQQDKYKMSKLQEQVKVRMEQFSSAESQELLDVLTGGKTFAVNDPAAEQAMNSGVPAKPETLQFARWLSNNASMNSHIFQDMCFDYSAQSSNALDSFATQILGMAKQLTGFLNMMQKYASPVGIARLEKQVENFVNNAKKDILAVANKVNAKMHHAAQQSNFEYGHKNLSNASELSWLLQETAKQSPDAGPEMPSLTGVWEQVNGVLSALQGTLPTVVKTLKQARKEVSTVQAYLESLFSVFKAKGSPVFDLAASLYKTLWTLYFVLFALLMLGVLYYAFWASGWFGGPQSNKDEDSEYEPPKTFFERLACVFRSCSAGMRSCQDSHMCFWSVIIFAQILVVVLFVVSIVLCVLAGVKALLATGCAQVYILGDVSICGTALRGLRGWLETFLANLGSRGVQPFCEQNNLLTCSIIANKMITSILLTCIGSMVAAVVSLQMIIEAGVLHERARWNRLMDAERAAKAAPSA